MLITDGAELKKNLEENGLKKRYASKKTLQELDGKLTKSLIQKADVAEV